MITVPRNFNELEIAPSIFSFPHHVAALVDNYVEHIFHCNEDIKNILISNPVIKQVESYKDGGPKAGWIYNSSDNSYSNPNTEELLVESNDILLPYSIAFIIDNTVSLVLNIDERLASVLLSSPIFKEVNLTSNGGPDLGWLYNPETDTYSV